MSGKRYPEEFKIEAVKQVVDRGYSVASVATRLDITTHSLYAWIKSYGPDSHDKSLQAHLQVVLQSDPDKGGNGLYPSLLTLL